MFLEHQIGILELFLKDHVTLKTKRGSKKIQLYYHRNTLHITNSKYITTQIPEMLGHFFQFE